MNFEWDQNKAATNEVKHEISFEEAETVFANPIAVIFEDEEHSEEEKREIIIGHSVKNRIIFVSFTERPDAIRIISARQATRNERKEYEQHVFKQR